MNPKSELEQSLEHLEHLRTEIRELQLKAEKIKQIRLQKEKEMDEVVYQSRLELAKANPATGEVGVTSH